MTKRRSITPNLPLRNSWPHSSPRLSNNSACSGSNSSKPSKRTPRVPFVVWRIFESYGNAIVKTAQDQDILTLKTALATEIAVLVEQDVQPDILTAIIGALQWRSPEVLEEIKAEVKRGRKPRLEGKESCLFLVVGNHEVML